MQPSYSPSSSRIKLIERWGGIRVIRAMINVCSWASTIHRPLNEVSWTSEKQWVYFIWLQKFMWLLIGNFRDAMKMKFNGSGYWRNPELASSCTLQLCSISLYPSQLPGHCYFHPHGWKEGPILFWHNLPALRLQEQFIGTMEKKAIKCYQVLNEVCYENVLNQAGKNQSYSLLGGLTSQNYYIW